MDGLVKTTLFIAISLCASNASAKSGCRELATRTFFDSDLAPIYLNNPEQINDSLSVIQNSETFCKLVVKALKSKTTTAKELHEKAEESIRLAEEQYERDGDMDALALNKLINEISIGAIEIAEK
ncbi:TPA: hypothetical protein PXM90_003065 [Yersinia enterocolitica]|nr:hypothetical protein [Yersinia enterocolitica]HDL7001273.1 hypothetical protein [Yersinia enterocolitica]HDL7109113.1 hypothetical protein [Yersinia enterocolitica]HDL7117583.1 hypothetical protein [Yersinia enterocolitica]HDL7503528.1 hypothetical protein [Yersinia enterocolitica]